MLLRRSLAAVPIAGFVLALPANATAGPSAAPCPGIVPVGATQAFTHQIDDKPTLRLIAQVEAATDDRRNATLRAIRTSLDPTSEQAIEAANGACVDPELVVRAARVAYAISATWPPLSQGDFQSIDRAASWAVAALAGRDRLAPAVADAALAPFGTTLAELSTRPAVAPSDRATPSPEATATMAESPDPAPSMRVIAVMAKCGGKHEAHSTRKTAPDYPEIAKEERAQGTVKVNVALDDEGLVRNVAIASAGVTGNEGGKALSEAALISAATAAYEPEIRDCKPVAGSYLFIVQFSGH